MGLGNAQVTPSAEAGVLLNKLTLAGTLLEFAEHLANLRIYAADSVLVNVQTTIW